MKASFPISRSAGPCGLLAVRRFLKGSSADCGGVANGFTTLVKEAAEYNDRTYKIYRDTRTGSFESSNHLLGALSS